jgi:hypothetical protein
MYSLSHNILEQETAQKATKPKETRSARQWLYLLYIFRSPFWLCLLLGILVRLFLVLHTLPSLAGDEATTGLQAENILRGQLAIYYYRQPYMGSLEAYILALFFAVAGPSVLTLRIGMLCTSLTLVCLTWCFGSALADQARLTGGRKTTFVVISTLIAALAPVYDTVLELRTLGGYIEAMIIMLWLLHVALRLTQRWHIRASLFELAARWAGLGFLVGLGIWTDPLVVYAIAAAALWIGWYILAELILPRASTIPHPRLTMLKETLLVLVSIPAALLGFAPGIVYGMRHDWSNITYMLHNGSPTQNTGSSPIPQVTALYSSCVAPRVIGGSLPTQPYVSLSNPAVVTPGLIINIVCIALACVAILLSFIWRHSILARIRQLTILPLIFMIITSVVYCVSSIVARENSPTCDQTDFAGRYAGPLVIALPFFIAAIVTFFWYIRSPEERSDREEENTSGSAQTTATKKSTLQLPIRALLLIVLAVYFSTQFYAYVTANQINTFKNPHCQKAPSDYTDIINYMQQIHLSYALSTGWIGDPLTFNTNEAIIVTEPPGKARIIANSEKVLNADHYGLLLFDRTTDTKAPILKLLDKQHYAYTVKRFPTIPGWSVIVISTPQKNIPINQPDFRNLLTQQTYDQC